MTVLNNGICMADVTTGPSYSITIVNSVTILWKSYKNSIRSSANTCRSTKLMHK